MIIMFISLSVLDLVLKKGRVDKVLDIMNPGIAFLQRYMPLMFCPALVLLPAKQLLPLAEIGRIALLFVIGYAFWLPIIAWMARMFSLLLSSFSARKRKRQALAPTHSDPSASFQTRRPSATSTRERASKLASASEPAIEQDEEVELWTLSSHVTEEDEEDTKTIDVRLLPPWRERPCLPHPFMVLGYSILFVPAVFLSAFTSVRQPAECILTVLGYFFGIWVPPKMKVVIHPIITCSAVTILGLYAMATYRGQSLTDELAMYSTGLNSQALLTDVSKHINPTTPGGGDLLFSLVDAAVVALAFRMFQYRELVLKHGLVVVLTSSVAIICVMFFHTFLGHLLGMMPENALAISARWVTTPLAIQCFNILGADVSLGVTLVLASGIVGDIIGMHLLRLVRIPKDDIISIGCAVGCTSHAIGTAGLLSTNPPAAAISSLSFVMLSTMAVIAVSIPPIANAMKVVAGQ
ncbi:hypothetical protein SmJEL517_g04564 [Synchytrium microbalum]|uniref:LrgB-like protein n=1 Tax=Synchytrium microbalum TaxID=1806994 RepID=A0A507BZH0_9FUNG|nr:uncharacterized protein SmJEL517_g04564 [Synchytrium microbalum]TPX32259.1 hypothetical protein SmJEL517_g04564 [Synchytrium microbalum]